MSERHANEKARRFLLAVRNPDGGWPYTPGNPSSPEATCYAAMALWSGQAASDVSRQAIAWISKHARAGMAPSALHSHWTNSLALLALERLQPSADVKQELVKYLLSSGGKRAESSPLSRMNSQLRGWSWIDATFSWVEPTSYALLALKRAGVQRHERIHEAERMLCDRVGRDGGWNYGNPNVRNVDLPPMMPTTALAAMALQHCDASRPILNRALSVIEQEVPAHPSTLSLALAVLCFPIYGKPAGRLPELLTARQQPDGSWRAQVHLTALALLASRATAEGINVFKV